MIAGPVLIDAGPLVALFAEGDQYHVRCSEQIRKLHAPVLTCWPVITEVAYLLRRSGAGLDALLRYIELRRLVLLPLGPDDATAIAAILRRFNDQDFDFADACLMHLAEREETERVFTLDRRHFGVFRTSNGRALSLLPPAPL